MIKWYEDLYAYEITADKLQRLKEGAGKGPIAGRPYCIALASNERNLFDIINLNELLFPHYQRNDIYIVGLAESRRSAMKLLCRIVEDVYRSRGDLKVNEYFTFSG